jgi:hypothetical protein
MLHIGGRVFSYNQSTPWSRVLSEKLIVLHLFKEFPVFY